MNPFRKHELFRACYKQSNNVILIPQTREKNLGSNSEQIINKNKQRCFASLNSPQDESAVVDMTGSEAASRSLMIGVSLEFGAWDLELSATSRLDVLRQTPAVGGKRFASAAPICRCNDRMALYPVEVRQ
jgi:hypothetical protein